VLSKTARRDWEAIASLDPYWAVLSEPDRKHGRWDEAEFFATGEQEVTERLAVADELGLPRGYGEALDFGCGLGRTARALAARFDRCVGLDITVAMLERARELNAHFGNLDFVRADGSEPLPFADRRFDLVYSSIVLQHLPSAAAARAAIGELARVTAPGGLLCFQLPTALGFAIRLQPRRTAYKALRAVRVPERVLYERLGLHPIRMLALPRAEVEPMLARGGLDLRAFNEWRDPDYGFSSALYYASRTLPASSA
jgi:SAM-dependent methyltransferase